MSAELFSINECESAFVSDFLPYKGSPDPYVVWRAAWDSAMRHQAAAATPHPALPVAPDPTIPLGSESTANE